MITRRPLPFLVAQAAITVLAAPPYHHSHDELATLSTTPSVETLFSLPVVGSWFENLVYRRSRDSIIATRLDVAQLWSISASTGEGTLLANITDIVALVGITQTRSAISSQGLEEEFWVAGLNFSTAGVQADSSTLWKLSFATTDNRSDEDTFTLEKAFVVPGIELINGLTTWNETTILAADSGLGAIWQIDTTSGAASIVLQDPTTMAPVTANGVNGVKVYRTREGERAETYIYYSSTDRGLLARILVDPITGVAANVNASVEILATDLGEADDFALLKDGGVIVATGSNNSVVKVGLDGSVQTLAGSLGSLELASATSCQFGKDEQVLYVTTAGGTEGPVNGTLETSGSIVAVRLGRRTQA